MADEFPPRSASRLRQGADPSPARREEAAAPAGAGRGGARRVPAAGAGAARSMDRLNKLTVPAGEKLR